MHQYIFKRCVPLIDVSQVNLIISCWGVLLTAMIFHQVEARINEESERAKHYLDPTTEEPIVKVIICDCQV